jgi:ATP-dependent DNA helicase RecQ
VVRDEILARLGLPASTPQIVRGFARPNLALRVAEIAGARERAGEVDGALAEALGAPPSPRPGAAIVYAPTRRSAEEEGARLAAAGWRAQVYHAGLSAAARDAAQGAFARGACDVVVATNAFGMGIDRADVRAVVHLAPPASIEAWYQEAGRAGRDGDDAIALLLVSPGDLGLRRRLLESDTDGRTPDPEIVRHKWGLFLELLRVAEGGSCRHDAILRYFGDDEETLAGCGRCDVCVRLADAAPEATDAERDRIVRTALSAVARVHGRFGLAAAVALARGADDPRLDRAGLRETPTFGALGKHDEPWLQRLFRRCVTAGWVDFTTGSRPVVRLTDAGRTVMKAERPARILLPPEDDGRPRTAAPQSPRKRRASDLTALILGPEEEQLFEALRARRLELARELNVPPFMVASDRTLRELASLRPRSPWELRGIYGIGATKAERFGRDWLDVIGRHRA